MHLASLLAALGRSEAWPGGSGPPDGVHHTHISAVFLVGDHAWKLKKPVDLGFLDFSTLERRRYFCEEEVRINTRYAPGVYLGVVPVARTASGVLVGGEGEVVDWLVKMRRLDDADTLEAHLARRDLPAEVFERLGRHIARLHAEAERSEAIARFGRHEVVRDNALENFAQTADHVGETVTARVWRRVREHTEAALHDLAPLVDARAERGVPCDTHGDLRLEHVYLDGDDLLVLDAIEFNERFRYADPVSDLAFLYMDCACRGRWAEAAALAGAWFEASDDDEARPLLPFYAAYRSVVRAKVAGIKLGDREGEEAEALRARARMHWLYALVALAPPPERPCVVGVEGLPGTGKSTLARGLAEVAGFQVIRSDVVRKELAGLGPSESAAAAYGEGLYSERARDRVYAACLERAERVVERGGRALVDASFGREGWRDDLVSLAEGLGVPAVLLRCDAEPDVVRARLQARAGDASDADWGTHQAARAAWEDHGSRSARVAAPVRTDGSPAAARRAALDALADRGLALRSGPAGQGR